MTITVNWSLHNTDAKNDSAAFRHKEPESPKIWTTQKLKPEPEIDRFRSDLFKNEYHFKMACDEANLPAEQIRKSIPMCSAVAEPTNRPPPSPPYKKR